MLKFGYSVLPQLSKEEEEEIYKNWNRENKAKLIESNIRLALHIANRYEGLLDDDDLISISLFGLVKAGNNYDPKRGCKFATFAGSCIENEINMALRKKHRSCKSIPFSCIMKQDKFGDEVYYEELICDNESLECYDMAECKIIFAGKIAKMKELERRVFLLWCFGEKQKDIADRVGRTQSCVSRILKRAIGKLEN